MALLKNSQFEENFEIFKQNHPELNESQIQLLELYFKGSNHFEKIIVSTKMFAFCKVPRRHFEGGKYCAFKDTTEPRWLAIEFFGEEIRFETIKSDPRRKTWDTEEEILEALTEWILKMSEDAGKARFPTWSYLQSSQSMPSPEKICKVTGCGLIEIFDRMYEDGLIPFKYIDKNSISITPRREDFQITGNESFWKEKEKRDGRVYRTAR